MMMMIKLKIKATLNNENRLYKKLNLLLYLYYNTNFNLFI